MLEIVEISRADAAWAEYVSRRADASLFHDQRWGETIESVYGHRTLHLGARRGGTVVGVLPLTDVRSSLFGRSLISGAFAVGGGVLADDDEAVQALGARALEIGRELGVNYVELRGGRAPGADWREKTGVYAAFSRELPRAVDDLVLWLPKNRRAQVKKAKRLISEGGARLTYEGTPGEFQPLYAHALRNLGTPTPPVAWFREIKERFGDACEISLLLHHEKPIAGLVTFWSADAVRPYYIGATPEARHQSAYDLIYFSLMERAVERGVRAFDYGRSKIGSPQFDTKTYWGFSPSPLVYHVALIKARELPNVSGANPKFVALSQTWKKLPLPVANFAGPILARHLA